jgi:hypothetical protein
MINAEQLYSKILNPKIRCLSREQIWHLFLKDHKEKSIFLEFGVWNGRSINYMASVRPECIFHGFDSFEGLPENWITGLEKGHFKTEFMKLKFRENIIIHKGWFDDTTEEIKNDDEKISGIHFDCDLGSSTTTILNKLKKRIINSKPILLFDEMYNYKEFENHEFKSFLDWVNENNLNFEIEATNLAHQQVLVRLT